MIVTITLNAALDRTLHIKQPLREGELNRAYAARLEPGGKGINASSAIKALGGESIAIGFTAGTNGRVMKDMLTTADIHHDFVDVAGQMRVNTQIIDDQGGLTEVNEPGDCVSDADFLRLLDRVQQYADAHTIFVLAGSTPPLFPLTNYYKLCQTIKSKGSRLVVDATGALLHEALRVQPDFVKLDAAELAELDRSRFTRDPGLVVQSARQLLERGANAVCVCMQHEGAVFLSKKQNDALFITTNPKIYSDGAVGTGDAMVGAIAHALELGHDFEPLARLSVAAGRASAKLSGTRMASLMRVYEIYETTQVFVL